MVMSHPSESNNAFAFMVDWTAFLIFDEFESGHVLFLSHVKKIIWPAWLPPYLKLLKLAPDNNCSCTLFKSGWGRFLSFLEFLTFSVFLLLYNTAAVVGYLNFVLSSHTEKLISDPDTPANQLNSLVGLLYHAFLLFNAMFLSFILFLDEAVSEIQLMQLFWLILELKSVFFVNCMPRHVRASVFLDPNIKVFFNFSIMSTLKLPLPPQIISMLLANIPMR